MHRDREKTVIQFQYGGEARGAGLLQATAGNPYYQAILEQAERRKKIAYNRKNRNSNQLIFAYSSGYLYVEGNFKDMRRKILM